MRRAPRFLFAIEIDHERGGSAIYDYRDEDDVLRKFLEPAGVKSSFARSSSSSSSSRGVVAAVP